jgi:hypothetical protein
MELRFMYTMRHADHLFAQDAPDGAPPILLQQCETTV